MLVTIQSQTNNDWSLDPSIPIAIRIFALQPYTSADGTPVSASPKNPGVIGRLNWSVGGACTITPPAAGAGVGAPSSITIPAIRVESTTDATIGSGAELSAFLFRTDTGASLGAYSNFGAFTVPSGAPSVTWVQLAVSQVAGTVLGPTVNGQVASLAAGNSILIGAQQEFTDTPGTSYADATVDASGLISEGTLESGQKVFFGGVLVQNGLGLSTATGAIDSVQVPTPSNAYTLVDAVTDAAGRVAWGIAKDGTVVVGGNINVLGVVQSSSSALGLNTAAPTQSLTPTAQQLASLTEFTSNIFMVTGQSLASGYQGAPALSTVQNYANLCLNGGPRVHVANGTAIAAGDVASLIPMVQQTENYGSAALYGETITNGFTDFFSTELGKRGLTIPSAMSVNCWAGEAYSGIAKGTTTYANGLQEVTAFKSLLPAGSGVRAVIVIHGETDDVNNNASYGANLVTWQQNYQADYQAITGQAQSIPFLICQMNSWTIQNRTTSLVAIEQLTAVEANPNTLYLSTPKYQFTYVDGLHLNGPCYFKLGEYHAKAAMQIALGNGWTGTRPKPGFPVRVGKNIFIDFYVPIAPLALDTITVTQPSAAPGSMYGFEFNDGSGNPPAIVAVQIVSPTTVKLTLAALPKPPTGATMYVSYAYTGNSGNYAGATSGARGNLRDSDHTASAYDGAPLWNWCVAFHKPVS